jgi:prepilin-type N-terminal cleavage/methylation domain-containing protein
MKNGFTLIELLAVIVILGVIAIISIPKIQDALYSSQDKAFSFLVTEIENKANDYVNDSNLSDQITASTPLDVYLNTLVDNGYLDSEDMIDPREKDKAINLTSSYVRFTLQNGTVNYQAYLTIE